MCCVWQVCFSGWHVLAKVALNDGVNAVALAMSREACATVLMFMIARRYVCMCVCIYVNTHATNVLGVISMCPWVLFQVHVALL